MRQSPENLLSGILRGLESDCDPLPVPILRRSLELGATPLPTPQSLNRGTEVHVDSAAVPHPRVPWRDAADPHCQATGLIWGMDEL